VEHKVEVPSLAGVEMLDEIGIAGRPLLLRVAGQHALQADTNALDVVYGTPALSVEEVEAYDTVGVDVRVVRDRMSVILDEDDFGSLCNARVSIGNMIRV
jgi:hypothetical protein